MNVTVQDLAPCKKLVRVEVEPKTVEEAFEAATKDIQRQVSLPGFRPGKAPRDMITRRFSTEIQDEVRRRLISEYYKKAIDEQSFDVVGQPDIEEIQLSRGNAMLFAATVETAPEFELPVYNGIRVQREARSVTDEDVERAIEALRGPKAVFNTVQRPAQTGDAAVVNYTGTCEGRPITELAPAAKGLSERKNFWVDVPSTSFIPGFSEQLLGAQAGDQRTVSVDFPADFVTPQLASKKGIYQVEVVEVKERVLPPVDEAFAKSYGAETLEKLREGVRRDLQNELNHKHNRSIRDQIMRGLLDRVSFDLPESVLARETRNVVFNIVQENSKRGASREAIEKHKDQIFSAATQGARERLKASFLLQKIAEKEKLGVSNEELNDRIRTLAVMYRIPLEKFVKDLQERNGMLEIFDQILNEKVLDLLQQNAVIEDAPPAPAANPS